MPDDFAGETLYAPSFWGIVTAFRLTVGLRISPSDLLERCVLEFGFDEQLRELGVLEFLELFGVVPWRLTTCAAGAVVGRRH